MSHKLKTSHHYWEALSSGEKSFDVRRDDRGFQRGHVLELKKYGPSWASHRPGWLKGNEHVTEGEADTLKFVITFILTGGQFGIEPGYIVMGLKKV